MWSASRRAISNEKHCSTFFSIHNFRLLLLQHHNSYRETRHGLEFEGARSLKGLGIDDGNETHGYVQSSCEIEHQEIKVAQQQCLDRSNTQQYTLTLYCYSLCVIGCRQSTAGLCNCLLTMVLVLFVWRKDSRSEEIVMPRMTSLRFGTWTGPLQICAPESHEP